MAGTEFIPVAAPDLSGAERDYVLDCIDSTWISSTGKYVDAFEERFADYCGTRHAISCSNGTVSLHAALLALGIGPGDEVIVPSFTYVASANAVAYTGATPVFVDSDPDTWNMSPADVEAKMTSRTRAIMAVHLYGRPCDMAALANLAASGDAALIEDAAEAVGAAVDGSRTGSLGEIASFSFYGNKVLTTGEGGMITTDDEDLASRARQIKGQGQDPQRRYWFPIVGYNYRMTNIAAAIGLAQLERIEEAIERRAEIARWYEERLGGEERLATQLAGDPPGSVTWLYSVVLADRYRSVRDEIQGRMFSDGIDTRPFFYPMHVMPVFAEQAGSLFPVAESLGARGLNLPTWVGMTATHVDRVVASLRGALDAVSSGG